MSTENSQGGRPQIKLDALQIRDVEVLAAYLPIAKIADYLGISVATFHRLKSKDSQVLRAYNREVSKAHAHAGNILMKFMQYDGDDACQLQLKFQAAKFYNQTKCGWGKNVKTVFLDIPENATPLDIINEAFNRMSEGEITLEEVKQIKDVAILKKELLESMPREKEQLSRAELQKRAEVFLKMNHYKEMRDELAEAKIQNEELKKQLEVASNTQQGQNSPIKTHKHKKKKRFKGEYNN